MTATADDPCPFPTRYAALRDRANDAARSGRLPEARELLTRALELAREHGDEVLADRAYCNLAAVEIEMGGPLDPYLLRLREILSGNADAENCRLAAYNLARLYQLRKEHKKGLFYARIATERSRQTGRDEWIASSLNLFGILLLSESLFDQARDQFEAAVVASGDRDDALHPAVLDNLGYCRLLEGRMDEGFRCLFRGLRMVRRQGARWWEAQFHVTLTFGYLEIGRWKRALAHGLEALARGEEVGDQLAVKNALFLLGEAANLAGDDAGAHDYFTHLQRRFFPDQGFLPDFLVAVDVRRLINLKA